MSTLGNNLFAAYWAQNSLSARSYIQNGLVNQWDGIENVGYGKHDSTSLVWRDLITNTDATRHSTSNPVVWGNDCWMSQGTVINQSFDAVMDSSVINSSNVTVEVVIMRKSENRSTIFGQYSVTSNNGLNLEGYISLRFRAYWNGIPDLQTNNNTFVINKKYYFATYAYTNMRSVYLEDGSIIQSGGANVYKLATNVCRIGCDGRTTSMNFGGNIYAIRVYNRTLSTDEIAYNCAIDRRRFNF